MVCCCIALRSCARVSSADSKHTVVDRVVGHALAAPDRSLRKELTVDNLHLNAAGYRAWVELLAEALP